MTQSSFCSKVLLFGEYSIIQGSQALAIPFPLFDGKLVFPKKQRGPSEDVAELKALALFLEQSKELHSELAPLDIESFEFDIGQGLHFESSIPLGYGLGSSGALTASVFDRYFDRSQVPEETNKLKDIFGIMESHFHGSSSGLDPLISFTNMAVHIDEQKNIKTFALDIPKSGDGALFLLNTGRPRRTEPLVNLFLEKCKGIEFTTAFNEALIPATNQALKALLDNDLPALESAFFNISKFQYEFLRPMVPPLLSSVWENGLQGAPYTLKLCGAGGGGFLLGHAPNWEKAKDSLRGHEVRSVWRLES